MEEEKWANIIGSKGYMISNYGRLKSKYKKIPWKKPGMYITRKETILKLENNSEGYLIARIYMNGIGYKTQKIHRLVATYFKLNPNPDKFKIINHIDGNKLNNYWKNLHWTTSSVNNIHALKNNLRKTPNGENKWNSKLKEKDVLKIRELTKNFSCAEIAPLFNVSKQLIGDIKFKRIWKHII